MTEVGAVAWWRIAVHGSTPGPGPQNSVSRLRVMWVRHVPLNPGRPSPEFLASLPPDCPVHLDTPGLHWYPADIPTTQDLREMPPAVSEQQPALVAFSRAYRVVYIYASAESAYMFGRRRPAVQLSISAKRPGNGWAS